MLRSIRAQLRTIREQLTGFAAEERAPKVFIVRGGLPGGSTRAVAPGRHTWHREPGETEAAFESRVIADARRLGVPVSISGAGLPQLYRLSDEERADRFRFAETPEISTL